MLIFFTNTAKAKCKKYNLSMDKIRYELHSDSPKAKPSTMLMWRIRSGYELTLSYREDAIWVANIYAHKMPYRDKWK